MGNDYALLQNEICELKIQATAYRTRAMVVEDYKRASYRNNLKVARHNLNTFAKRRPPHMQQRYFGMEK